MKTTKLPWFVGNGVRHTDTVGICCKWSDGDECGEETIAEVLPGARGIAKRDADLICKAVNEHEALCEVALAAREYQYAGNGGKEAVVALTRLQLAFIALNKVRNKKETNGK